MNSIHQSVRSSPLDEGEPCLKKDDQSLSVAPDSLPSRCSYTSVKQTDYVGRCILFLLILAVFLFGVVIAFLVGHWAANTHRNSNSNTTSTPVSWTTPSTRVTQTPTLAIRDAPQSPIHNDRLEIAEDKRNLTLLDVYPPSAVDITPLSFHFTSKSLISKHRRVPLIPLPKTVLPVHYDIQLDFTAFSHDYRIPGNVSIVLQSFDNASGNDIVFHSSPSVHIDRLRLHQHGRAVLIRSVRRVAKTNTVHLTLKDQLKSGWCTLEIQFASRICDDEDDDGGVHCYRSAPTQRNSKERRSRTPIISFTTKFEPTLARSFIPCWDEPHIKATFNVSVLHSRSLTVLSNAAPYHNSNKPHRGVVLTRFHETPPMSVYLLAFAVGPFVKLEMSTERAIPITIWTLPEDFLYARFAANFSPIMFDRHEEEFAIEYPFSKLDFVAARSFPVGGMENWGLVVFHNDMILLDSFLEDNVNMTVDLLAEQYAIEKIITHEITHQWFGNLVTMNDWSEIWLNEGFASFYVTDLLKQDHPYLTSTEYYLHLAQLLTKQTSDEKVPLVRAMRSEAEVEDAFDRFHLYTKGCVIINIIKDLVSEIDFRDGVRKYLKKNAFKAVGRDALWKSMPAYADHGVDKERLEDVVEPWLVNAGMPEVIVSRNYNDDSIRVTQRTSDQNRYVIYLNDVPSREQLTDAELRGQSQGRERLRRSLYSSRSFKTIRNVRRDNEGDSTPFDDSMFDNFESLSSLGEKHKGHTPTKSEEIVRSLRRRKQRGKNRRMRLKSESRRSQSRVRKSGRKSKFTDLFIPLSRDRARKYRRSQQESQLWSIPFSYRFGDTSSSTGELTREFWLHNETMTFVDIELLPSMPLLANLDWKFPFRVNYDISNWRMLATMLHEQHHRIPVKSRMQLITDAEFYLKQSGVPQIYLYILGYLSKERDMGVLMIGLDAIYRFVDMFRGTHINALIIIYLRQVISQIDTVLEESRHNAEEAAVWLIDANRLTQLYQLRCVANLSSCEHEQRIEQWLMFADVTNEDHFGQMTAVCHHLFTQAETRELHLVANGLKHFGGRWSTALQLATCVRDETILKHAVKLIIGTKNAAVYAAVLQNEYTLHYNGKLRELLWSEIALMSLAERKLLFSVGARDVSQVARILVHSVRSSAELQHLQLVMPHWGSPVHQHIDYLTRQFNWIDHVAVPRIHNFLADGTAAQQ